MRAPSRAARTATAAARAPLCMRRAHARTLYICVRVAAACVRSAQRGAYARGARTAPPYIYVLCILYCWPFPAVMGHGLPLPAMLLMLTCCAPDDDVTALY